MFSYHYQNLLQRNSNRDVESAPLHHYRASNSYVSSTTPTSRDRRSEKERDREVSPQKHESPTSTGISQTSASILRTVLSSSIPSPPIAKLSPQLLVTDLHQLDKSNGSMYSVTNRTLNTNSGNGMKTFSALNLCLFVGF